MPTTKIPTYIIKNISQNIISLSIKKPNVSGVGLLEDVSGNFSITAGTAIEVEQSRLNKRQLTNLATQRPPILDITNSSKSVTTT